MKIAIYGKNFDSSFNESIVLLFKNLEKLNYKTSIYKPFLDFIIKKTKYNPKPETTFNKPFTDKSGIDLAFSIGGDGTFLQCVSFVRNRNIPIVGINSGRLGFLANISKEEISTAISAIHKKKYTIQDRTLIQIKTEENLFSDFNYGLNEVTVHKRDSGSMITLDVYLKNNFLNSYWADGLIISTPTGSTAYSLSAGGPIVVPDSQNFILTPISSHNLTVRPMVVPDNMEITIEVNSRSENCLVSLDYRSEIIKTPAIIKVNSADFKVKILNIEDKTFFGTLRNKLMWGIDKRNKLK